MKKQNWFSTTDLTEIKGLIAEQRALVEHMDNILIVRGPLMSSEEYLVEKEKTVAERNKLRGMVKEAEGLVKKKFGK